MSFINLRNRTEHSFGTATGRIKDVIACQTAKVAGICDRHGTWGHFKWSVACKEAGIRPIFGVELAVVKDMEVREKQPTHYMSFLARNNDGLREIYELTTLATEKFYYIPRIDYHAVKSVSKTGNVIILSGANPLWEFVPKKMNNFYVELNQLSLPDTVAVAAFHKYPLVATSDNLYPRPTDKTIYQIILGRAASMRTAPGQILDEYAWEESWPDQKKAISNALKIANDCKAELSQGQMVKPKIKKTLAKMCEEGAKRLGIDLKDPVYKARLKRELDLIKQKEFEDYFYVVADMVEYARANMLVGPGRGSSCGSLVCYLTGITGIDPIPYGLLFERFIDINRSDFPDIDIDFPDDKREMVFDYVREKYGTENVSRIGTVNLYKADSAIIDVSKAMKIPLWDVQELKNSIIERNIGDARVACCIADSMDQIDSVREFMVRVPEMRYAAEVEGAARHTGVHAAGILITAKAMNNYCAVNIQTGAAMIDKKDAEKLNLLKIDALGLRTLSVIDDVLHQVGWSHEKLERYPTDDKDAFRLLGQRKFSGVFQFEGPALQGLTKQIPVEKLVDVVNLTALARPGPLESGGTAEFIKRRNGVAPASYLHPMTEQITKDTYGVIVYQEQVMKIVREIGNLSWEDVTKVRTAMAKSHGKDAIEKFAEKFMAGAKENKVPDDVASLIWEQINTYGSYGFNLSHALAYSVISYWCLVLKAKFPLEFAAACLRNAMNDEQSVRILRELVREGYKYKPYDALLSEDNWIVRDGLLIGGLTAIKGIGPALAKTIKEKRQKGMVYTERERKLLESGETPWDNIFECNQKWKHIKDNPREYGIESKISDIDDVTEESEDTFVFIGKMIEYEVRDHNEAKLVERRGNRMDGLTTFLQITVEDDTGSMKVLMPRSVVPTFGPLITETSKSGDWFLFKGTSQKGFRSVTLSRLKKLTGNSDFHKKREKKEKTQPSPKPKKEKPVKVPKVDAEERRTNLDKARALLSGRKKK